MKKTIAVILTLSVMLGIIFQVALAKEFSDMPSSHWAFQYVDKLSNEGVINGYEDGSFRPSNEVTRAEYIKLVVCSLVDNSIFDEPVYKYLRNNQWYVKYVNYAKSIGIVPSYYFQEDFNGSISREDMAYILYKSIQYKGLIKEEKEIETIPEIEELMKEAYLELGYVEDESGDGYIREKGEKTIEDVINRAYELRDEYKNKKYKYEDTKQLPDEEVLIINTVSEAGLIKGYEDNTFRPYNNLTRAEVATVIYRFMNLLKEG